MIKLKPINKTHLKKLKFWTWKWWKKYLFISLIILSIFILSSAYLSAPLDLYAAFVASVAMLLLPAGGGIKKVMKAKVFDGGRFKNADGYKTD